MLDLLSTQFAFLSHLLTLLISYTQFYTLIVKTQITSTRAYNYIYIQICIYIFILVEYNGSWQDQLLVDHNQLIADPLYRVGSSTNIQLLSQL